jgi:hypothetical protein
MADLTPAQVQTLETDIANITPGVRYENQDGLARAAFPEKWRRP